VGTAHPSRKHWGKEGDANHIGGEKSKPDKHLPLSSGCAWWEEGKAAKWVVWEKVNGMGIVSNNAGRESDEINLIHAVSKRGGP